MDKKSINEFNEIFEDQIRNIFYSIRNKMEYALVKIYSNIFEDIEEKEMNEIWIIFKENIIKKLNKLKITFPNYIPCERKIYLTRPKLREVIRNLIQGNNIIYNKESPTISYPKSKKIQLETEDFIKECVKILVDKQQGLNS
jgi:hypothetical protein